MNEEKKIVLLDVNDILPNRFQPRIKFNEDSINELSESIKKYGVIEPIVVRAMGDKYEIIAGERRYKASLLAGKEKVPAIITSLDDKDSAEVALIENVQREDLTPIEEAISYKKILDMGYLTQEELATKLGKNQGTVANKLRLLNLTDEVQEALLEEKISERHARSLLKIKNDKDQIDMLNNIINNRLTVRKTDEAISELLNKTSEVKNNTNEVEEQNVPIIIEERKEENNMNEFNPFISNDQVTPSNDMTEFNAFANIQNSVIEDTPAVNNEELNGNQLNPGFMDVNKIEETAQDINSIRPQADINSLLTPSAMPINNEIEESPVVSIENEPVQINESQPTEVEQPATSKFFNIPLQSESTEFNPFSSETDNSTNNSENIDEQAFISSLNSLNNEQFVPTSEEKPAFSFNFTPVSTPNANLTTEESTQVAESLPEVNNKIELNKVEEITPIEPITKVLPLAEEENNINSNVVEPKLEIPQPVDQNIQQPVEQVLPQPEVASTPINSSNNIEFNYDELLNSIPNIEENNINSNIVEPKLEIPQPVTPVLPQIEVPSQNNLMDALNLIRDCSKTLEKMGFHVEVDEANLGNLYQVTFNIENR